MARSNEPSPSKTAEILFPGTSRDPPRTPGHGNPGKGSRSRPGSNEPSPVQNGRDMGSRDLKGPPRTPPRTPGHGNHGKGSPKSARFQRALSRPKRPRYGLQGPQGTPADPPADPRSREPRQRVPEVGPVPTSPLPSKTAQKRPRYGLQGPPGEFDVQGVFAGLE